MRHGCAANTCRQPGAGWWTQGRVRLSLCERHGRIYESLGYVRSQPLLRKVKDA
jgi:hypothetical protein